MSVVVNQIRDKLIFTAPLRRLRVEHVKKTRSKKPVDLKVRMRNARIRLHPALEPTDVWTYDGLYPGKVFVVRKDQTVAVEWINQIEGTLPVDLISCGTTPRNASLADAQNEPGKDDGGGNGVSGTNNPDPRALQLPAWTVVHLHGGRTAADSDGWTENAFLPRSGHQTSQRTIYANDQRATFLWYHDHAMSITRLNVYAGLAGGWIIRDKDEDKLGLPSGDYELPLVIQDRNLGTAMDKTKGEVLTGRLLHKVETHPKKTTPDSQTMEFFGPFTLVNGTIWPYCKVEAKPYRLRVLNGSNARTYQLFLMDEQNNCRNDLIRQIGTDGGLLPKPVPLVDVVYPGDPPRPKGLVLAPAERVDLIVDFQLAPNSKLTWFNVAPAPYDGEIAKIDPNNFVTPGQSADAVRLPYPEVIRFDVAAARPGKRFRPRKARSPFVHYDAKSPKWREATHRWLALNETWYDPQSMMPDTLFFNELVPLPDDAPCTDFTITLPGQSKPHNFKNTRVMFSDAIKWIVDLGKPEIWHIINFTADAHPIHLHLTQFQILGRDNYHYTIGGKDDKLTDVTKNFSDGMLSPTGHPKVVPAVTYNGAGTVDPNEQGWKDTVRVNPNGMVTIGVIFDGYTGRYMYHCHILEHEDMEMMRPLIVMPKKAQAFMMMDMSDPCGMQGMKPIQRH